VSASESRRLAENVRQLAGSWSVAYTIIASKSQKAVIESKISDLKVTSFSGEAKIEDAPTTPQGLNSVQPTSSSVRAIGGAFMAVSALICTLSIAF